VRRTGEARGVKNKLQLRDILIVRRKTEARGVKNKL